MKCQKSVINQMAHKWGSQTSDSYVWLWRLCSHSRAPWHMLRGRVPSSSSIWDCIAPVERPFLCLLTAPIKRRVIYMARSPSPPKFSFIFETHKSYLPLGNTGSTPSSFILYVKTAVFIRFIQWLVTIWKQCVRDKNYTTCRIMCCCCC